MHRLKHIMDCLEDATKSHLDKGIENVDAKEMGEVIDMIKDCCEAMYYYSIYEAMQEEKEEDEEERKYYRGQRRDSMGRYTSGQRGGRRGFEPHPYMMRPMMDEETEWERMQDMQEGRMYYPNQGSGTYSGGSRQYGSQGSQSGRSQGNSRYGYSHDEYMKSKQWDSSDPEQHKMRKQKLDEYLNDLQEMGKEVVQDMSPEEKQLWKQKISKLMNL